MTWTKDEVRMLRLRLGWSQADLARRLNVEVSLVIKIEDGDHVIEPHMAGYFALLQNHADLLAEEILSAPLVETHMASKDLDQINQEEFKNIIFN